MNQFGLLKSKILQKLEESYISGNKTEMKDVLNLIKSNKDFKEMYLFYEDIENKYFDDKDTAKLYVEELSTILKEKSKELKEFCNSISNKINVENINENAIYMALDQLSEGDNLDNIDKKVIAKKHLVDFLTTKKTSVDNINETYTTNQSLLYTVLTNNFNVLYSQTLNESQQAELKEILSLSDEEIKTKVTELSEAISTKVETMLNESSYSDISDKLKNVRDEVSNMTPSKYNYYRLKQLENGLN